MNRSFAVRYARLLMLAVLSAAAVPAEAFTTFTVTTTADNGSNASPTPGSLRQMIVMANGMANDVDDVDHIVFAIPGAGVQTITPLTDLPAITDPVTIDGYTQAGTSENTLAVGDDAILLIELNGDNVATIGLDLVAGDSTVRGLVLNHFDADLFGSTAIRIASSNNLIAGNFIGSNAAGTAAVHNHAGIRITAGANNVIGGTTPAERNVIAGSATPNAPSGGLGVVISTTQAGTRIQGNYIGTDAAGNAALGLFIGIHLIGSSTADVTIGGITPTPGTGAGNVISGNSSNGGIANNGIFIANRPGDLTIQGNIIGLNAGGATALPNGVSGIHFQDEVPGASVLLIGGTATGARNVIFNNRITGIVSSALGLQIQGNYFCTDVTGTTKAPAIGFNTGGDAISIGGSATIGGATAAARNVFGCNGIAVHVFGGSITLQGNAIGTAVDGTTALGNSVGVRVDNDAVVTVGGTGTGEGNVIANSFLAGVTVRNTARTAILGNSIFGNGTDPNTIGHPGIDLNNDEVTDNDACDPDTGPNGLQNYPELATASSAAGGTTITGSLNAQASTTFRVEFFASPTCNDVGNGEGKTYLGSAMVTTDANCTQDFAVTFQPAIGPGQVVTATATDPSQNTSEFSACIPGPGGSPVPTPSATGPVPTRTPAPEDCYDCIDNDGNGLIDRNDGVCPQRANGLGVGLDLPAKRAKAVVKCAKTLGKAGLKFSGARLKHLQKCVNAAFLCVQLKPNDEKCKAKARKTCGKELTKATLDGTKLKSAVLKACAAPAVDESDLRAVVGVGYLTEAPVCQERGIANLLTASDVADCVVAQHACRVEDLVATQVPRAAELVSFAGHDPAVELPCLAAGANGGGSNVAETLRKATVKCQQGIGKAGAKFASAKAKALQKCANAVYACLQVKPSIAKCRQKAATTCTKQLTKLMAPGTGAIAKLTATIAKSCTKAPLTPAEVLGSSGLGFTGLGSECEALGAPALDSVGAVTTCIELEHRCRIQQMLETEMPRLEELVNIAP